MTARKDEQLLKTNNMNKDAYYKQLQVLQSWKNYALSGIVANVPVANKIDEEIFELQEKYGNRLN